MPKILLLRDKRFRSSLLKSKLRPATGGKSLHSLTRLLTTLPRERPKLITGFRDFNAVNCTLAQCARLLKLKSVFAGRVFLDWNLKTDRIESGRQWKSLLGYVDDELADTLSAWRGLVRVADLGRLESAITAHAHSKSAYFQVECRLRAQAGGWKWLRLKGMVASRDTDGDPTRIFLMQQDITDRKHAEALALQVQTSADSPPNALMNHEIHTPIDGILGMTELALDTAQRHYPQTRQATENIPQYEDRESLIAGIVNFRSQLENESGYFYMEQLNRLREWLNTHIAHPEKTWPPISAARTIKK